VPKFRIVQKPAAESTDIVQMSIGKLWRPFIRAKQPNRDQILVYFL